MVHEPVDGFEGARKGLFLVTNDHTGGQQAHSAEVASEGCKRKSVCRERFEIGRGSILSETGGNVRWRGGLAAEGAECPGELAEFAGEGRGAIEMRGPFGEGEKAGEGAPGRVGATLRQIKGHQGAEIL